MLEFAVYLSLFSHLIVSSLFALAWACAWTAEVVAAAYAGAACLEAHEIVFFLPNTFLKVLFYDIIIFYYNYYLFF